jgi:hypothetical protein
VEWIKLLEGALGATPMAACLGFAVHTLWRRCCEKEAEIQRLNEARVQDLKAIAERDD